MKANEFVKKFGVEKAKEQVILKELGKHPQLAYWFDVHHLDLKRLVESHDLVKDLYGLAKAKEYASSPYTAPELVERIKQAIAGVESCQKLEGDK